MVIQTKVYLSYYRFKIVMILILRFKKEQSWSLSISLEVSHGLCKEDFPWITTIDTLRLRLWIATASNPDDAPISEFQSTECLYFERGIVSEQLVHAR